MSLSPTSLVLGALLVVFSTCLWFACRRWYAGWLRRRLWARAQRAEARAAVILERLGYTVLGTQIEGAYQLVVDGRAVLISLRADYLVTRSGRRFVAEVKSGRLAPLLATPATRRQLLEYLVAFQADGVLLVDGETQRVHEVEFPVPARAALASPSSAALGWMAAALVVVTMLVWWLRGG